MPRRSGLPFAGWARREGTPGTAFWHQMRHDIRVGVETASPVRGLATLRKALGIQQRPRRMRNSACLHMSQMARAIARSLCKNAAARRL